jgi:hypothetical protein
MASMPAGTATRRVYVEHVMGTVVSLDARAGDAHAVPAARIWSTGEEIAALVADRGGRLRELTGPRDRVTLDAPVLRRLTGVPCAAHSLS